MAHLQTDTLTNDTLTQIHILALTRMHAHKHTDTLTRTCARTHSNAGMRAHVQCARKGGRIRADMHAHTHMRTLTDAPMQAQAYTT
eukprot:13567649-Alexandrium_andersonii.AAC.1